MGSLHIRLPCVRPRRIRSQTRPAFGKQKPCGVPRFGARLGRGLGCRPDPVQWRRGTTGSVPARVSRLLKGNPHAPGTGRGTRKQRTKGVQEAEHKAMHRDCPTCRMKRTGASCRRGDRCYPDEFSGDQGAPTRIPPLGLHHSRRAPVCRRETGAATARDLRASG